jgi:hypothetical protein
MENHNLIQYFDSAVDLRNEYPHYLYWGDHDIGYTEAILDSTLDRPWRALNSWDSDGYRYPQIVIFGDGCLTWGNNRNCSQVCGNRTALFGNWLTQWTCLTLATLLISNGTGLNSTQRGLIDNELTPLDISLGKNNTGFNAMGVLEAMNDCAIASCNDKSMGNCTIGNLTFPAPTADDAERWIFLRDFRSKLSPVCDDLKGSINVDIAGPGVSCFLSNACSYYISPG